MGRRIVYAFKSSVMARGNDGIQHVSVAGIDNIAGASFISRAWPPFRRVKVPTGIIDLRKARHAE
jgi:hypothetical protein